MSEITYHDRVRASIWVWLFLLLIAGSLGIAAGAALGDGAGWTSFFGSAALPAALLIRSTVTIEVADGQLRVDQARLPVEFIAGVTALDAAAARRLRGPEQDPAAHLVLRGWIPTAVRVDLHDPQDPVPYWYISTNDPEGLAAAIERART